MKVRNILMATRMTAAPTGRMARRPAISACASGRDGHLAHALGGCVLKEDEAWVAVAKPQLLQSVKVLMGLKD